MLRPTQLVTSVPWPTVLQGIASLDKKPVLFHILGFELWNDDRHQPHAQTA